MAVREELNPPLLALKMVARGHGHGMRWPLAVRRGKEVDSPLESSEGNTALLTLVLDQ